MGKRIKVQELCGEDLGKEAKVVTTDAEIRGVLTGIASDLNEETGSWQSEPERNPRVTLSFGFHLVTVDFDHTVILEAY
jgi:hypothetical protein